MQIIPLYRYIRKNGGITVSPNKPDTEYTEMVRLVEDDGKVLTKDGENFTTCVDTDTADGWYEVEVNEDGDVTTEATEADYQEALEHLGVNFDE